MPLPTEIGRVCIAHLLHTTQYISCLPNCKERGIKAEQERAGAVDRTPHQTRRLFALDTHISCISFVHHRVCTFRHVCLSYTRVFNILCNFLHENKASNGISSVQGQHRRRTYNTKGGGRLVRTFTTIMLSRRWCGFAALLLLSGVIPIAGGVFQTFQPEVTDRLKRRDCPTACSDVFGRLEWQQGGLGQDKAFQKLTVHERGGMCSRVLRNVCIRRSSCETNKIQPGTAYQ